MTPDTLTPAAPDRLAVLFRDSLRGGQIHPLWQLMQRYRAQQPRRAAALALPAAGRTAPAVPRPLPLQADTVRRTVGQLPPLPQAALRALQTLRRDEASLDDVAADLGCDASLTARVLRLANSPFYGVAGRVSSARDAVQLLGRRTLESVLTLTAVAGQLDRPRSEHFEVAAFWRHALGTGLVARGLARGTGLDEDQAFVAGLLHDIGLLAMSVYFPAELDALLLCARAEDLPLCEVERRHGLTPHADVGAWIAAHWHFPAPVVHAIAAHHGPVASPADVAACVHVAVAIAHALDVAGLPHDSVPPLDHAAWQRFAPADGEATRLLEEAEAGVHSLSAALSL